MLFFMLLFQLRKQEEDLKLEEEVLCSVPFLTRYYDFAFHKQFTELRSG